jgi:hypothetical protein
VQVQAGGSGTFLLTLNYTDQNGCACSSTKNVSIYISFTQTISLLQGWSIISTYIVPFEPNCYDVFDPVLSDFVIAKNGAGAVFWPLYSLNQIGSLVLGEGYQLKMIVYNTLDIVGTACEPQNTPINLPGGWSIAGYLRQTSGLIVTMLSPIVSNIIIVKNGAGNVYWPQYTVDNIVNMNPGEGYQIKVTSPVVLTYPANSSNIYKVDVNVPESGHFGKPVNTGNNMTLGLPYLTLNPSHTTEKGIISTSVVLGEYEVVKPEIGIFTQNGLLIGSGICNNKFTAITLWGDDELTPEKDGLAENETFSLVVWNPETGVELPVEVENWFEGDGLYKINGISIAGKLKFISDEPSLPMLYQNIPNPYKGTTNIEFYLPEKMNVSLILYDVLGKKIQNLLSGEQDSGKHKLEFISKDLLPGEYFYSLITPLGTVVKRMTILR